jgi:hypothetical protein
MSAGDIASEATTIWLANGAVPGMIRPFADNNRR